jgi:predicted XRE-type DNA-binding protein
MKPVIFVGSSLRDLKTFPQSARREAGFQIANVQSEDDPDDWKPMKNIGPGIMVKLRNYIEQQGMTQEEAARRMGVTQPRISDLVRGKIDRFTIDMLVNMLSHAGIHVELVADQAA